MSGVVHFFKKTVLTFSLFTVAVLLSSTVCHAQSDGAKIFNSTCKACHFPSAKKGVGPGLKGFWDRIPGDDDTAKGSWFISWVKDPQAVINSGDAYAVDIRSQFPILMTGQPQLSDADILSVSDYIKNYSPSVATTA